ncbi:hypothetical protein Halhy_0047 [Haliscomenobacter hydrossis DSM 1100]|uniref:Uncharacterized protein n=2 Tax=Haliscomenobacter TaxID=2349 RepID=F4KRH1_HALH1|nr:hypothetical protein Halhy_0047 [Haliscomenobacter hydrossis DSM 1100]
MSLFLGLTLFCGLFSSLNHYVDQAQESKLLLMQYRYIDGNNNAWNISKKWIEYKPISKVLSSSGNYSGGEPFQAKITTRQYRAIRSLLQNAMSNTAIHLPNRLMGSGTIIEFTEEDDQTATCYLPMNSPEKAAIEDWLNQLKN